MLQVGPGVAALEFSADLQPASPASTKSVIAQVRFYDARGLLLDVSLPQLRRSEKVGGYFYPYDYRQGDAFRFVVPAPEGVAKVEVVLRHWRKLDRTPYSAGAVSIQPTDPIATPRGRSAGPHSGESWPAERALRAAIKTYAIALTSEAGPLTSHEAPFGEAIVEHFILETKDVGLARGLAVRRLDAGRDRDALSLLPLASDQRLLEAASRRALLQWAAAAPSPEGRARLGDKGGVIVVAQSMGLHIDDPRLNALAEQGWPLEVFAPASSSDTSSAAVVAWTPVEPPDASEKDQIPRLADQIVRAGRGRDLRLVWAASATDALAAAEVGRRLALPVAYEVLDLSSWIARLDDAAWRSTDEGQREESLFRAALRMADLLLVNENASRVWLSAFVEDSSRIFITGSEAAMWGRLASPVIEGATPGTDSE
ncbi:MAG: hypothetical protein ACRED4_05930 [Brevundimonas sp.]